MQRLSPLDASFLHIEDDVNHMHIGSVGIFEGPPPSDDEIATMVEGKLPLVPRYRQRVRFVPLHLGRPVWVDDPHFNLGYHVRHTALPSPGGTTQLRNLVGRVMAQQLDRTKPLWEMWVVDGLEDDHWALISKTHHCMVDGIAGTDLLTVILDSEPEPAPRTPDAWSPGPEPSDSKLVADALGERARSPYEGLRGLRSAVRTPRRILEQVADLGRGAAASSGLLRQTPPSSLNGPIGPHRRWAWARTTLPEVKTIRAGLGGTVNDVVLTAITRGFRDLLESRGESTDGRVVRTLVPVSVRTPGERGTYNNRVSGLIAELPVGIEGAVERLNSIREQLDRLKASKQAVAAETLTSMAGFAPPMLLALGARVATRLAGGTRSVNTVTTNVPGPQFPLYARGRRMVEVFPYVPLASPVRVGIAIFSYDGRLTFGATADFDTAPDVEVLTQGIEEGIAELTKAAPGA
jgi:diacylglycerol O-acyltransferase / wax synthase